MFNINISQRKNLSNKNIKEYVHELEKRILAAINSNYAEEYRYTDTNDGGIYHLKEENIKMDNLSKDDILNIIDAYNKVINLKNCGKTANSLFSFIEFYIYKYWDNNSRLPDSIFFNNNEEVVNYIIFKKLLSESVFSKDNNPYVIIKYFIENITKFDNFYSDLSMYVKKIVQDKDNTRLLIYICNFIIDKINSIPEFKNSDYNIIKFELFNYYFYFYTDILNYNVQKFMFYNNIFKIACRIIKNESLTKSDFNILPEMMNIDIINKNITPGIKGQLENIINKDIESNSIATKLVGIEYYNEDHKYRKKILSNMLGDSTVYLELEPDNKYDNNAIAVYTNKNGDKIGYIPRETAQWLSSRIRDGLKCHCYLKVYAIDKYEDKFINKSEDILSLDNIYLSTKLEIHIDVEKRVNLCFIE